ncbi:MAG: hypothetical protein PHW18_09695 [Sulfuricurvum sp.]|uniref:hypothetical protein n=1 Tax=Sulfuricurvum sp. TaxID=2025608 RepID=UPI0026230D86|nr:hypothetical protein [Sulfuricurvum sp.]MDD2829832.1 hypothetical protein [Sulfuricurvum sp.]MDD4949114.1 hypothetical protein [Sulfuricurvum sp.]
MSQMVNIPVNDIAPLAEIHDYSFYYFIALILVVIVVIITALIVGLKYLRHRQKSVRRLAYEQLSTIDLGEPKRAAYAMSELGRVFAHDNERTEKAFHNLFERLEPYKYAPKVEMIDEETLGYYHLYLGIVDV